MGSPRMLRSTRGDVGLGMQQGRNDFLVPDHVYHWRLVWGGCRVRNMAGCHDWLAATPFGKPYEKPVKTVYYAIWSLCWLDLFSSPFLGACV